MLIKEYRMVMPLSVDEYCRAQRYMVAKFSRQHTGHGEGVEIVRNEPYENETGKGQYTLKRIHISKQIPGWISYLVPSGALIIEEEAWNAYPHCKTTYRSPFLGARFSITIETHYRNDDGSSNNLFPGVPEHEVDFVDLATEKVDSSKYKPEEDPALFHSEKSGRGPFAPNWKENHQPIMCSYKLCTAEFKYWGLQSRVENFIHLHALRNVFLLGHRQAICWMDEWWNLTMEDILAFEQETQNELAKALSN
eukprot:TRINITY_DN1871_c0_g1_i1.p1 TRINITY_DN1871_c0_g1~~TRINITY_DN1871_c0_g1_i1.p1  ORF type:complete len:251 (-),score=116.25 TRINITY_DN1871_c0_g1_i1:120-872(-)